jgi:Arc/MetJ-type ribon-helix-helix transcriptional regulator
MRTKLTIRLPQALSDNLTRAAKGLGLTESEFVRRAVQRQLWEEAFEESRRALLPKASAKGVYTDADLFKIIS